MGQKEFDEALEQVKSLPAQSPEVLLNFYGLFKQATAGDVTGKVRLIKAEIDIVRRIAAYRPR